MRGRSRQKARKLSLWSKRGYCELDGRLIERREERKIIAALTEHVGVPSAPQAILIRRAARLLIMIAQIERRIIEGNDMGDLAGRQVVALHNALRLSLSSLGLERGAEQIPTMADFLKSRRDAA